MADVRRQSSLYSTGKQNQRDGFKCESEFSNIYESGNFIQRRTQNASIKRSKYEIIIQSVQTVLKKNYFIPPDIIRDVIPQNPESSGF